MADAGRAADIADALDNSDEHMLWHWELRLLQSLSKPLQAAGKQLKKTLNEVLDYLLLTELAVLQLVNL